MRTRQGAGVTVSVTKGPFAVHADCALQVAKVRGMVNNPTFTNSSITLKCVRDKGHFFSFSEASQDGFEIQRSSGKAGFLILLHF